VNRLVKVAELIDGRRAGMTHVVDALSPDAHTLQWSILDLGEVIYEERWDLNMPVIEEAVAASSEGMQLSFDDLMMFGDRVQQVIDGLFVGCRRPERPRRDQSDEEILARSDMLVAAVDSTFWLVAAPDEVLARYEPGFKGVETVEVTAVGLSTWGRKP
jgi:hypothetical protein